VIIALTVALGSGVLLWITIRCGWNAPRPTEPPDWETDESMVLQVSPPEQETVAISGTPVAAFTAETSATPQGQAAFNGYGLVFRAQSPERYAVFAVGSDGYLAVLARDGEREIPWLDWRAFPHVRRGEGTNRLRLTCAAGECRFWVNDEYVTSLPDRFGPTGRVGVWARRRTGAPLEVSFDGVSVWEEK
jgi:hypothetical protein